MQKRGQRPNAIPNSGRRSRERGPLAKLLEACNSAILREQAQIFRKFRRDDGKLMKSPSFQLTSCTRFPSTLLLSRVSVC